MELTVGCFLIVLLIHLSISPINCQRQAECCEQYCYDYDRDRPQSSHFASKTAYQIVKGRENSNQFVVPNCTPTKAWMLSRHGTRLPSADTIEKLKTLQNLRNEVLLNYEERRSQPPMGALCEGDLELLRSWNWDYNITSQYSETLTTQGWDDLKFLAIRYKTRFQNIFNITYDARKFLFRYTDSQRTEASFRAFVEGLFGLNAYQYVNVPTPSKGNDTLLRPYETCPAWIEQDKADKLPDSEVSKFERSSIFNQTINDISLRLGFKYPLEKKQIDTIFEMCRYNQAWELGKPSPWCVAFTPSQVNVLEYREDLKYYYKTGYGSKLNLNLECAAIADMLKHLESNDFPQAVSYFSHASAIQLFLTALGIAEDTEKLRADNYFSMSQRKWKSSHISPFTSNLVAIKYNCPNEIEKDKVMFALNEKPLQFNWCKVGLCDLSQVKEKLKKYKDADCGKLVCSNSIKSVQITALTIMLPLIAYLFVYLS